MGRLTTGSLKKTKAKVAAKESMTQAIMQAVIEDAKAAIMAVREAVNPVYIARLVYTTPASGGLVLK